MFRSLPFLLVLSFFALSHTQAQTFYPVNHISGTQTVGGVNTTVTPTGVVGSVSDCGTSPYRIGSMLGIPDGYGKYTFTFATPITGCRIKIAGINSPEVDSVFLNGVFYPITTAGLAPYPGTCNSQLAQVINGTVVGIASGGSAGGQITILSGNINSIAVSCRSNTGGSGNVFSFGIATNGIAASNNGPLCAGSTLQLSATNMTGATYSWTGPNNFTSFIQNPTIPNVTAANAGTYIVTATSGNTTATDTTHVVINPTPNAALTSFSNLTNPTSCTASDGSFVINGLSPIVTQISYTKDGTPVAQNVTVSGAGTVTFTGLQAGTYTNFSYITANGCSAADQHAPIVLSGAAPPPTFTSPLTYCQNAAASPLSAMALAGYSIRWYMSATGGLGSNTPPTPSTTTIGTTTYYVSQIGPAGCESPRVGIVVNISAPPGPPRVSSNSPVCIGDTIRLSGSSIPGASFNWTGPNNFTSTAQNPVIPQADVVNAGYYVLSVTVTGCPGAPKDSTAVVVNALPATPAVTNVSYCYGDNAASLMATPAAGNTLRWYTIAIGGTASTTPPVPPTTNGDITYYVSQVNSSGCEGPRAPLTVKIKIVPGPVVSSPVNLCQFQIAAPLTATGDTIRWYPTPTGGAASTTAPTPVTTTPGTFNFYVTQRNNGCTSPRAQIVVIVNAKPSPPGVVSPLRLCQYDSVALTANGQNVRWYLHPTGGGGQSPFIPPTGSTDDSTFYYATQTVNGCESDRTRLLVTVTYKPNGIISATRVTLCQEETDSFYYFGNARPDAVYNWTNPHPATTELSGAGTQGPYIVRFDSAGTYNVTVQVNNRGCLSDIATQPVTVRPSPAVTFDAPDHACVGEIINIALSTISPIIDSFRYDFGDGVIRYGTATGGPYGVVYSSAGQRVITTTAYSRGCPSRISGDTFLVHALPDARFTVTANSGDNTFCTGDSLVLTARETDSNTHFIWTPDNFFATGNLYTSKGFLYKSGYIRLSVTSGFGCKSSDSLYVKTESCCQVFFPNAFSPNGDTHNDVFRPVSRGHHQVKTFRIVNRWGQVVYESQDEVRGWDGTYNGKAQDMGTYYYYLSYRCGEGGGEAPGQQIEEKGEFLLIR